MATHTIAQEEWRTFFEALSQRRQGARVELALVGPESGVQPEAIALPLVGIYYDQKGSAAGTIAVVTGTETGQHITHTIRAPKEVIHKDTHGELLNHELDTEAVEVTSHEAPPITIVRFMSRAAPEA